MVLSQYELVPNPEFVSYYYQLLVRYTCIARMRSGGLCIMLLHVESSRFYMWQNLVECR